MALTAQVAVSNATFHFDKLYTYAVPLTLASLVRVGSMVLVPFGYNSTKARMGVVLAVDSADAINCKVKHLYDIAPEQAMLSEELLQLVFFLREHTFCTYYEAVKAIIPYGAQYKADNTVAPPRLVKQIVRHTEKVYTRVALPEKLTQKQMFLWELLAEGPMAQTLLLERGASKGVLDLLVKKGVLECTTQDKTTSLYTKYHRDTQAVALSAAQQKAFDVLAALQTGAPAGALLHGVTSSGKTLVFLSLIERTLKLQRKALVLVPEISLTPQMIYRLKAKFGERVAVQHSALNHTERLLQWQQIQNGQADIVVGTRSAVFAPLESIGLIIIDEEQEHTYHSESAPRYCAHDVAKQRAAAHGALLVLASATPSVERYYAAKQGRYTLVELAERYNQMPLPAVRMVNMREELGKGNTGAISAELGAQLQENLRQGKQSILLLNRRGYQTVGMCTQCAEVYRCDACSVPMVHHKADNQLLCHYCAKTVAPVPESCPQCGGKLKYTGFGTQRVEEELAALFPSARVLRMDADSTGKKNAHETMLRRFAAGEYDILLGTQMVAKGLDFEKVTLVGVLGIDQLLFAQGYQAFENVFSLVTQVVGRGGRAAEPGRALIQTVDPDHPVLQLAAKQDYASFYAQEVAFRKLNLYPPFCAVCIAGFSGEDEAEVLRVAHTFSTMVQEEAKKQPSIPLRILGPAPMQVAKVNNRFRAKLTLKCRNDKAFRALMRKALGAYSKENLQTKASIYLDFHANAD